MQDEGILYLLAFRVCGGLSLWESELEFQPVQLCTCALTIMWHGCYFKLTYMLWILGQYPPNIGEMWRVRHAVRWKSTKVSEELQSRRISQARSQQLEVRWQAEHLFLAGLILQPEDGGSMFLWNVGWLSVDCMVLWPITIAVRTSNCA
jgi:hypothetical protein